MPQKRMECLRLLFDHLAWIEHQFLSGIRDSRKAGNLWGMMQGVGGVRKSIHQSWLAKGLGLLCWGFKGVQEEIPREEASTFQIGSVAFPPGQCTNQKTPSLSQTIWPRWASKQFLSLPIFQTLLPVTFGYSLSSEGTRVSSIKVPIWKKSGNLFNDPRICFSINLFALPRVCLLSASQHCWLIIWIVLKKGN